jgi:hypothetical protein
MRLAARRTLDRDQQRTAILNLSVTDEVATGPVQGKQRFRALGVTHANSVPAESPEISLARSVADIDRHGAAVECGVSGVVDLDKDPLSPPSAPIEAEIVVPFASGRE